MIKLLISDLDGTLLNPSQDKSATKDSMHCGYVPTWNIHAVQKLELSGVDFAIATGRMQIQTPYVLNDFGKKQRIMATQNGAFIQDQNGDIIKENIYAPIDAYHTLNWLIEHGFTPIFSDFGTMYFHGDKIDSKSIDNLRYHIDQKDFSTKIIDFYQNQDIKSGKIKVSNIILETHRISQQSINEIVELLKEYLITSEVVISSPTSIDLNAKGFDKANAIDDIANHLNLKKHEIAFIGDSFNDMSSMAHVDNSFAMSHSPIELHKHSNYVVDSVSQAIDIILDLNQKENEKFESLNIYKNYDINEILKLRSQFLQKEDVNNLIDGYDIQENHYCITLKDQIIATASLYQNSISNIIYSLSIDPSFNEVNLIESILNLLVAQFDSNDQDSELLLEINEDFYDLYQKLGFNKLGPSFEKFDDIYVRLTK